MVTTGYRDRHGRADFRKTRLHQRVVEGKSGCAVEDLNLAPNRLEDCQDLLLIKGKAEPLSLRWIERELNAAGYWASSESRHVERGAGTVAGIVFLNPSGGRFDVPVVSFEGRLGKIPQKVAHPGYRIAGWAARGTNVLDRGEGLYSLRPGSSVSERDCTSHRVSNQMNRRQYKL